MDCGAQQIGPSITLYDKLVRIPHLPHAANTKGPTMRRQHDSTIFALSLSSFIDFCLHGQTSETPINKQGRGVGHTQANANTNVTLLGLPYKDPPIEEIRQYITPGR